MPSPNPREDGISPKADNGILKEKEKEKVKEKEKGKKKVEKETEHQAKAKEKDPGTDVGSVAAATMHPIALKANPRERAKQDPHTGLPKKSLNGMYGVKFLKCDRYQDYRQWNAKGPR